MLSEGFLRAEHLADLWHGEELDALFDWIGRDRPAAPRDPKLRKDQR
jgi:hypothetical protein